MTHGSLFSGIGGFDLAAEWIGWENKFHCEINEFCQKVLKYHFPNSISYGDIKATDFSLWRNRIDVLSGGFPCQPFSNAGEQKGDADSRFLFEEMLRAIYEIKPKWIVAENVRGITSKKFRKVYNKIQTSLANSGYKFLPILIPATSVGAAHERYRIWVIAYANGCGLQKSDSEFRQVNGISKETPTQFTRNFATQWDIRKRSSGMLRKCDGVSFGLDEKTISIGKWRKESIKAFGNAVVPQIPYQIFKAIEQFELINDNT